MNQLQIARAFSVGNFSPFFNQFSDQIIWDIIGQQRIVGISAVKQHCLEIEKHFQSVEHNFQIIKEIQHHNLYFIQGTAEFITHDLVSKISACDIYTFNHSNALIHVESYCISV